MQLQLERTATAELCGNRHIAYYETLLFLQHWIFLPDNKSNNSFYVTTLNMMFINSDRFNETCLDSSDGYNLMQEFLNVIWAYIYIQSSLLSAQNRSAVQTR